MYRVVRPFFDLQDKNHEYAPGDTFPRAEMEVSAERIAELASDKNRRGVPVIEKIAEKPKRPRNKRVTETNGNAE